jgi:RimJ/RimL family protein N-acetyltransferase
MSTIASANASASAPGATAARLRPARAVDAYALWIWANDPDMRHAAYDRAPIRWDEHLAWLARALHDPAHVVLLAESDTGQPLGAIRFESADGWQSARLSYVLAPEERGQGLARPLVRAGVERLRESRSAARVWAEVRADNVRSLRVFRWLGWQEAPAGERGVRFELP